MQSNQLTLLKLESLIHLCWNVMPTKGVIILESQNLLMARHLSGGGKLRSDELTQDYQAQHS